MNNMVKHHIGVSKVHPNKYLRLATSVVCHTSICAPPPGHKCKNKINNKKYGTFYKYIAMYSSFRILSLILISLSGKNWFDKLLFKNKS